MDVKFKSLGREVKISPKSLLAVERLVDGTDEGTVDIKIGSGRATLKMDDTALKALKLGESVKVTTAKEFRQKVK